MRTLAAAVVVAVLALSGQAAAQGFGIPFCGSPDQKGGSSAECYTAAFLGLGALIAIVAVAVDNNDHGKSA